MSFSFNNKTCKNIHGITTILLDNHLPIEMWIKASNLTNNLIHSTHATNENEPRISHPHINKKKHVQKIQKKIFSKSFIQQGVCCCFKMRQQTENSFKPNKINKVFARHCLAMCKVKMLSSHEKFIKYDLNLMRKCILYFYFAEMD